PPKVIPKGFIHTPQLSPSLDLFFRAKAWKKGQFSIQDYDKISLIDDSEENIWFHLYSERFNRELRERPDMVKALQKLIHLSAIGETIYLFCYCKNVH